MQVRGIERTVKRARAPRIAAFLVILAAFVAVCAWLWSEQPWRPVTPDQIEELIRSKRFGEAVRKAERLLAQSANDPAALFKLARARAGAGDLDGAVKALRRIPAWSRYKDAALFFEAKSLLELRRGRQAEAALLACVEREALGAPPALDARLELFALYAMNERRDAFKKIFWSTYPLLALEDRLPALTMRMRLEFEQTKPELNAQLLRRHVENDPLDAQSRAGLAAALDHAGEVDEALRLYEDALALEPADPELRERFMDLLLRSGKNEALERVLAQRPPDHDDRPVTQKFLGILAQAKEDHEAAARAFSRAVERDPASPELRHRLAQALTRLGRTDEAAVHSQERARLNEARERLRQAWNAFADAFEQDPESVPAHLLRGVGEACRDAGMEREADAWLAEAQRLEEPG